jgi:hypothetical protein
MKEMNMIEESDNLNLCKMKLRDYNKKNNSLLTKVGSRRLILNLVFMISNSLSFKSIN